jgi:pimeloyl-ACP methyl ester carboxylesterase
MNPSPFQAELVNVRTEDGVLLHGAFFKADRDGGTAAMLVHGGWGNFYTGLGRFVPGALIAAGITCLSINNRGHDYGTVADSEPCIGLLREQFEDSPKDISAGLHLLQQRGYRRLILIGHSYGGAKVVYSQFQKPNPYVEAMILCSPAALMKDTWKFYLDVPYDEAVEEAKHLVEAEQGDRIVIFRHHGPMPLVSTARTFLSVWGPDTLPDVRKYIGQIERPLMITICEGDRICLNYSRAVFNCATQAHPVEYKIFPCSNHYYQGMEIALGQSVSSWLCNLGLGRG